MPDAELRIRNWNRAPCYTALSHPRFNVCADRSSRNSLLNVRDNRRITQHRVTHEHLSATFLDEIDRNEFYHGANSLHERWRGRLTNAAWFAAVFSLLSITFNSFIRCIICKVIDRNINRNCTVSPDPCWIFPTKEMIACIASKTTNLFEGKRSIRIEGKKFIDSVSLKSNF